MKQHCVQLTAVAMAILVGHSLLAGGRFLWVMNFSEAALCPTAAMAIILLAHLSQQGDIIYFGSQLLE